MSKEASPLIQRWRGEEKRVHLILEDLKAGRDWTVNLLSSSSFEELPLVGTCSRATLETEAAPRDLRGLKLQALDLTAIEGLGDTSLDYCTFEDVILTDATFSGSQLKEATFYRNCVLDGAKLMFADLRGARFQGVSMQRADFSNSNIQGADFRDSDLRGCTFVHTRFNKEGTFGFLKKRTWTRFGGEYQTRESLAGNSDQAILSYISGEYSRWLLNSRHPVFSFFWYVFANWGRSPTRLFCWMAFIWLAFSLIYLTPRLPAPLAHTGIGSVLTFLAPNIIWSNGTRVPSGHFEPFYFSTVTLTTLGYGDVHPVPGDWKAELYVSVEALCGYVILGIFVALLVQNSTSVE